MYQMNYFEMDTLFVHVQLTLHVRCGKLALIRVLSQPIDHPWLSLEWSWDVCRAGHTFMLYVIGLINHFVRPEDKSMIDFKFSKNKIIRYVMFFQCNYNTVVKCED